MEKTIKVKKLTNKEIQETLTNKTTDIIIKNDCVLVYEKATPQEQNKIIDKAALIKHQEQLTFKNILISKIFIAISTTLIILSILGLSSFLIYFFLK